MNQVRYSIDQRIQSKNRKAGKKISKQKQELRIKKHLSQLPIDPYQQMKQNHFMNVLLVNRPQSSLITYQNCIDRKKKKRLSIDSIIKNQRDSLISKNSRGRKRSKNSQSFDEQSAFKNKLGQWRKKFNLSCNDMLDEKDIKLQKKTLKAQKKQSINNSSMNPLLTRKNKKDNDKSKTKIKKQFKNIEQKNIKKNNTTVIYKQKNPLRKKSQTTIIPAIQNVKKNPKNPTKKLKQKKLTMPKNDNSYLQYPINKYIPVVDLKKSTTSSHKKSLNQKSKSKSRSKQKFQVSSCLNILSGSSGLIKSSEMTVRDNIDIHHILKESQLIIADNDSLNLSQIRFYQNNSPKTYKNVIPINYQRNRNIFRSKIKNQIMDDYPGLNEVQINFLASVIFIQRKWKQYQNYNKIKNNKLTNKTQEDKSLIYLMKETRIHSITIGQSKASEIIHKQNQKTINEFYDKIQQIKQEASIYGQQQKNMKKKKVINIYQIGIQVQSNNTNLYQKNTQKDIQQQKVLIKQQNTIQKQQPNLRVMTDRTPFKGSQIIEIPKATYLFQEQIFPPLTFIEIKYSMIKNKLQNSINNLKQLLSLKIINHFEYSEKKKIFQEQYRSSLQQLKKSKKSIKKGFLKYVECLQKTKLFEKSGLRRVSSQSGFMSILYKKIYKFERTITESSDSSESIQRLARRVLVRKQYLNSIKNKIIKQQCFNNEQFNSNNLYNQIILSQKLVQKPYSLKLQGEIGQFSISKQMQMRDSSQMINISDFLMKSKRQHIVVDDESEEYNDKIKTRQNQLITRKQIDKFNHQQQIFQMILNDLTRQLHQDLILFNTITIQEISPRSNNIQSNCFNSLNLKLNEKYKNQYIRLSPASSERQSTHQNETQQVKKYLYSLINFIKDNNQIQDIIRKMNLHQGFSGLSYLKFLRDFQLPQDQYDPILKNEIFIEYQSIYISDITKRLSNFQLSAQFLTIIHRCLFEAFNCELEKNKRYGEKGQPFPWENTKLHTPTITVISIGQIFEQSAKKVIRNCNYACGIIDSKHKFYTEEQLQRIHQQNEDRIITMLQDELIESGSTWYQVQQYLTEFKLQISQLIEQYIMKQFVADILKLQMKN